MVFCLFMQMNMVETQAATKVGNTKITSITQTGKKSVKVAFKKVSGAKGYTLQYRTAGGSWKTKNVTVIIMKPIQMGTILRWAEKNKRRVLHLGRIHLGMKNLQTLI